MNNESNCYGDGTVYRGVRSKDSVIPALELSDELLMRIYEEVGDGKEWAIGGFASAIEFARIVEIEVSEKVRAQVKEECAKICDSKAFEPDGCTGGYGYGVIHTAKELAQEIRRGLDE